MSLSSKILCDSSVSPPSCGSQDTAGRGALLLEECVVTRGALCREKWGAVVQRHHLRHWVFPPASYPAGTVRCSTDTMGGTHRVFYLEERSTEVLCPVPRGSNKDVCAIFANDRDSVPLWLWVFAGWMTLCVKKVNLIKSPRCNQPEDSIEIRGRNPLTARAAAICVTKTSNNNNSQLMSPLALHCALHFQDNILAWRRVVDYSAGPIPHHLSRTIFTEMRKLRQSSRVTGPERNKGRQVKLQ